MQVRELTWSLGVNGADAVLQQTQRLDNSISGLKPQMEGLSSGLKGIGGQFTEVGGKMNSLGRKVMMTTLPLQVAGVKAIKDTMDFSSTLSQVEAISGATDEQMERLKNQAKDLSKSNVFNLKEIAEGYTYMGMAGWDAEQSLTAMPAVLNLATAAGEDLALTSDIVTDTLTAMGMTVEDTTRLTDVMAAASSNSNTNVALMGETFKYAAPLAGTLGYSIEDLATVTGAMASGGIKGSQAGTSLRMSFSRLAAPTKEVIEGLSLIGLEAEELQGLSLDETISTLRTGFSELSKDQKAQAASAIFGTQAMSGMLTVLNMTEDEYGKLREAIYESKGLAETMKDTMMKNLGGSWKIFKNSLMEAGVGLIEAITPVLTTFIQGATKAVQWFSNLSEGTKKFIGTVGLIAVVAGPALMIGGKLLSGIGGIFNGLGALVSFIPTIGTAFLTVGKIAAGGISLLLSPVGLIIAGVAAVGYVVYKNWDSIKTWTSNLANKISSTFSSLSGAISNIWNGIKATITGVLDAIQQKWQAVKEFFATPIRGVIEVSQGAARPGIVSQLNNLPGHATGLERVPRDNYLARLHKDEMVMPASTAETYRRQGGTIHGTPTQGSVGVSTSYAPVFNITVNGGGKETGQDVAREVEKVLNRHYRNLRLQMG